MGQIAQARAILWFDLDDIAVGWLSVMKLLIGIFAIDQNIGGGEPRNVMNITNRVKAPKTLHRFPD